MVLLFKGIAPPSPFPATIASGAPPRPNHACFEGRVDVCSETRWRSKGGRGLFATRALRPFPKKKRSLRALRAHNERTYTSGTSCAGTRRVPFVGCSSSGSQNMGDGSGGDNGSGVGGNATSPLHSRGSPKRGGQNQNRWGPQVGGNATSPLHSRGSPKRGGQNQNRWGPQVGGNATSPLHSRGSPKRGTKSE